MYVVVSSATKTLRCCRVASATCRALSASRANTSVSLCVCAAQITLCAAGLPPSSASARMYIPRYLGMIIATDVGRRCVARRCCCVAVSLIIVGVLMQMLSPVIAIRYVASSSHALLATSAHCMLHFSRTCLGTTLLSASRRVASLSALSRQLSLLLLLMLHHHTLHVARCKLHLQPARPTLLLRRVAVGFTCLPETVLLVAIPIGLSSLVLYYSSTESGSLWTVAFDKTLRSESRVDPFVHWWGRPEKGHDDIIRSCNRHIEQNGIQSRLSGTIAFHMFPQLGFGAHNSEPH